MSKLIRITPKLYLCFYTGLLLLLFSPNLSAQLLPGWDWDDLLDEGEYFESGDAVLQIGIGLRSSIDLADRAAELDQIDVESFIPALHLSYERQVWGNLGAGITLGTQIWKVPVLDYQYRYYTAGLRLAYHLNIADRIDPYIAAGATYRRMVLTNSDRNISESTVTPHLILGLRYYLTETIGTHIEFGDDATSWFKLGFSFHID